MKHTATTVGDLRAAIKDLPDGAPLAQELKLWQEGHLVTVVRAAPDGTLSEGIHPDSRCKMHVELLAPARDWRSTVRDQVLHRLQHANDGDLPALVGLLERLDAPRAHTGDVEALAEINADPCRVARVFEEITARHSKRDDLARDYKVTCKLRPARPNERADFGPEDGSPRPMVMECHCTDEPA